MFKTTVKMEVNDGDNAVSPYILRVMKNCKILETLLALVSSVQVLISKHIETMYAKHVVIEGLSERTEYIDIFLFSTHHSVVFCFRCSVYW